MAVGLVGIADLSAAAQREAAELVYQSLPAYYDVFCFDKPALISAICEQFRLAGSEVAMGVALYDGAVAGVSFSTPGDRVRSAQLISLGHLRKLVSEAERPGLSHRISAFANLVQPAANCDGRYLSRFAVRADRRGAGVADTLVGAFLQSVRSGGAATLHVKHDNERAKRFYMRSGFTVAPDSEGFDYMLMHRHVR